MKGGYQILDLKGVDLFELNGTTKVINLTDEEVKGLESGKPILLNNVSLGGDKVPSVYAVNDVSNIALTIVDYNTIYVIHYDLTNKKITSIENYDANRYELPDLPETTANKTYVLKFVNGSLTWVEETE